MKCPKCKATTWIQTILDGDPIRCCSKCTWNELYQIEPVRVGNHQHYQWQAGAKFMKEYAVGCCNFWLDEMNETNEWEYGADRVKFILEDIIGSILEEMK